MQDVNKAAPPCPKCQSKDVVAILYGTPSSYGLELVQQGERELGGCTVSRESPMWACKACHERFGNHMEFYQLDFSKLVGRK